MKRLPAVLASLAAISALALGLSGCNVTLSPYAAIVNGTVISQTQLRDALSAIANNASYKCAIEASGTTHVAGAGQGTYNSAFSAQVLSILIQDKVVRQYVSRLRLPEPQSLSSIATSQLATATAPPSTCPGSGQSLMAAFVPSYRALIVKFQVDEDALSARLAGASLENLSSYVAAHRNAMSLACVSVIEVASQSTAKSLRTRLLHGASFASLAKADSTDATTSANGGAIGCVPDADFTAPLNNVIAGLKTGLVSSPISFGTSSTGSANWLLLLVTKRQAESYPQLVSSIVGSEQAALNKLFPAILKRAKVQVDPQFGTWDAKVSTPRVNANAGPPAAVVPNPSANSS